MVGVERLHAQLGRHRAQPLQPLLARLLEDVDRFPGGREPTDDRALLTLRMR